MFPSATVWLGPGTTEHTGKGYPTDSSSTMFSELLDPEHRIGKVNELDINDFTISYGDFKAFDFFNDETMLLCDAPGHIPGNMCAIVNTTKGSVCLGGDCAHHVDLLNGLRGIGQWKNDKGELTSMHHSIQDARSTIKKLKKLQDDGVIIALAHDPSFEWTELGSGSKI